MFIDSGCLGMIVRASRSIDLPYWLASCAAQKSFENDDSSGSFEKKYEELVSTIQGVYDNAKGFHSKGIEMLIKEFEYHP